jgi:hypothetical protein
VDPHVRLLSESREARVLWDRRAQHCGPGLTDHRDSWHQSKIEWFDDAFAFLTSFRQVPDAGKVAKGFDRIYSSLKVVKRPLPRDGASTGPAPQAAAPEEIFSGSFAEQLEQLAISREAARGVAPAAEGRGRPQRPTVATGRSLGSALTTLFVLENAEKHKFDISTLCTFASPRVGNGEFVRLFNGLSINSWRIVNTDDEVPKLPFRLPLLSTRGYSLPFRVRGLRKAPPRVRSRHGDIPALAGWKFEGAAGMCALTLLSQTPA